MKVFKPLYLAWGLALLITIIISPEDVIEFQGITELKKIAEISDTPESPTRVSGLLHETVSNSINIGDPVNVRPFSGNGTSVIGEVVKMDSKITAYPGRLEPASGTRRWGRVVEIRLPEENRFLQGERVKIRFLQKRGSSILSGLKAAFSLGNSYAAVSGDSPAG